jgi:hypothetical protein
MATVRLPNPGGDDGTWGDILNSYLEVSLASNGTLNSNVVGTSQIQDGAVTNAKLDSATQSTLASVASKYTLPSGGIPASDMNSSVQSNLTKASTAVQIGGDLSGTNTSPTVAKISGVAISGTPSNGQVLTATGATAANWATPTGGASGPTVVYDTPEAHGAKRDGLFLTDVTITNSSHTLTSPSATFSSANVGMHVIVRNPSGGASLTTTVTGFTDSHNLVLAATSANLSTTSAIIGTDDTAAIAAAVQNAVSTAQSAKETYAEVWFSEGIYMMSGATTKGGATLGNSQIPLPVISSTTSPKFTLAFKGIDDASATPHWQQNVPNVTGSVICSTLQSQSNDGTWGYPSVVGGPTPQGLGNTDGGFMNMHIIIDGLSMVLPYNPTQIGFDFRTLANATIKSASILPFETPAVLGAANPTTFNGGCIGIYMPSINNNDVCEIGSVTVYGTNYGIAFSDHFNAKRVALIFCNRAFFITNGGSGSLTHGGHIEYASVEGCSVGIDASGCTAAGTFPLTIDHYDTEVMSSFDVSDPSNALFGYINWFGNGGYNTVNVQGASNFRVLHLSSAQGAQSAPTVSGSGTSLKNPFWRDCAVTVSSGTVTDISVDGTSTGITSGTVIVPTGKSIKLTYSGSPAWTWVAL